MKYNLWATTVLSAASIASPANAQQPFDLGTVLLSPSLTPVEPGRTGTTVELLEGKDAGASDTRVIDRLKRLPGVNSKADGGLGARAGIQIRGLPSRYVNVRLNGIDVADTSGPQNQYNFGGLTASGVQRIEVLKGSQSALYGSEAIAGVVNITTYQPEKLGFSGKAAVEAGSYGTYSGSLSAGYRSESGYVALSYGRVETDGFSAQSFNDEDDGFEQSTVDMTAEYDVTDRLTVGGALHYRNGKVEIDRTAGDASGTPPTLPDQTGEIDFTERGARVFATLQAGAVTHTLSYNYFDIDRDDPDGPTATFTGERQTFAYLGTAELGADAVLSFGIDHTEEKFTADTARGSEDDTAIHAELMVALSEAVDVSAALRHDDDSSFGGKTTGRLAAVWRPEADLAFRAVVGTGYRAPSLYERFGSFGLTTLQPEESISYELGVEKTFDAGFVKATLFYTDIDDLIQYADTTYNQVSGTTTAKGLELSGEYALNSMFNLYGAYTYTEAETKSARLTNTPRHDLVLGVEADFTDRFAGYLGVRHVSDVLAGAYAPPGNLVGDYTLVGTGVSYDVTDDTELYLRVENLLDEDYETVGGYNQPGRSAYVGLRANF